MNPIFVYIFIGLALFAVEFIAKKRFGMLGFALGAGSILSGIWGYNAGLVASFFGFPSGQITSAFVFSAIVLLPAGILLFHGPKYKTLVGRIVGSGLFTLLALAFLIEPLNRIPELNGYSNSIYLWLVGNRTLIIGVGLVVAIVDLLLTKSTRQSDKKHTR